MSANVAETSVSFTLYPFGASTSLNQYVPSPKPFTVTVPSVPVVTTVASSSVATHATNSKSVSNVAYDLLLSAFTLYTTKSASANFSFVVASVFVNVILQKQTQLQMKN